MERSHRTPHIQQFEYAIYAFLQGRGLPRLAVRMTSACVVAPTSHLKPTRMFGSQLTIRAAAASGRRDMVVDLLREPDDAAAFEDFPLRAAAAHGHVETVRCLLADPRVQPSRRQNQALRLAAANGHLAVVCLLLDDARKLLPSGAGDALAAACAGGYVAIAERLLADARIDLSSPKSLARDALQAAIRLGHMPLLERLLADDRIAKAEGALSGAMVMAATVGSIDVVERILAVTHADFVLVSYRAVEIAAQAGHLPIVRRLLSDVRMQEVTGEHRIGLLLRLAATCGAAGVVDFILTVAPGAGERMFIGTAAHLAAASGQLPALHRLMADPRLTVDLLQMTVMHAARAGRVDVIDELLRDPRLDPAAVIAYGRGPGCACTLASHVLAEACAGGHVGFARRLVDAAYPALPHVDVVAAADRGIGLCMDPDGPAGGRIDAIALLEALPDVAARLADDDGFRQRWEEAKASLRHRVLHPRPRVDSSPCPLSRASVTDADAASDDESSCDGEAADALADGNEGDAPTVGVALPGDTRESVRSAFAEAVASGDLKALAAALAHPLLDPQAPLNGDAGKLKAIDGRLVPTASKFALQEAITCGPGRNATRRLAAVKLLLADPCWEPRHVTAALAAACKTDKAAVVELLLADHRCELSLVPQRELEAVFFQQAEPLVHTPFEAAAGYSRPRVLQVLVAEGRRRGLSSDGMGAAIWRGVCQCYQFCPAKRKANGVRDLLTRATSALHACVAAVEAGKASMPVFLRSEVRIDVAAIGAAAWARRRHVVAARVRALERLEEE